MELAATKHARRITALAVVLLSIGCSTGKNVVQTENGPLTSASVPALQQCDITPAIDWMRDQKIIYTQNPSNEWRDCTICPNVQLAAPPGVRKYVRGGDNDRPGPEEARSTRALAKWYDDRGQFIPIYYDGTNPQDAPATLVALRNKIKTGTVLWFSPDVPMKADGKAGLYRDDTKRGVINHMGTVVSVTRDEAGNVTGWKMYHGQNPSLHNGVTEHYWKRSGRSRPVPQGGYGQQRIVGFAESIIPPAHL